MLGSNILDVAIGVVCLFLLLSLLCSAGNELIEAVCKNRCKDLEKGIIELIGTDPGQTFVSSIYNHGLVNSLFRGRYGQTPKRELPSYIPSVSFAIALLSIARTTGEDNLPANVRSALQSFRQTVGSDEARLQKSIEDWYNSAMDRVSGWYKRRTQGIIFVLGCVLTVLANADCIHYAKELSQSSSLRQSAVAFAEAAAKTDITQPEARPIEQIQTEINSLQGIGLPIGWQQLPAGLSGIGMAIYDHGVGWLLTAIALSLGAPFWFDTLNRIMIIRSTVKPREKSGEEASKDPTRHTFASMPLAWNQPIAFPSPVPVLGVPMGQGNMASDGNEIDGCEVPIGKATADEELPAAQGGVA